ncbi:hypothetical protein BGZ99_007789 [Dissophora globulifera]|uniref:Disease resistance R13L4/SHOC-2-like LRR domain-containing protein n=1 Tax=Dissophora globulifera TaxID=979702 RepID=A0A9P6R8U2_9FUNG|nr:hypothetical protein BGZ99_007789 [Dissophora globulifera]
MDHDYETVVHLPEDFFGGHHRYGTDDGNDDSSENDDDEHDDDRGDYVEVKRLSSGKGMGTSIADHSTTTLVSAGYSLFNYSMMKGADEDVAHLCPIPFSELPSLSNIGLCSHGIVNCCNDLCNIPVEIGYLRNLTLLDLSKNSLTTLPDSITQLTKLADLKLSYNFLESIPSTIGKLTKLTSLSLGNNRLTQIPSQIGQLKDLAYFDLSDNPLTVLPAEIARLQYLRRLRLDRCPLLKEFVHVPLHAPPTLLELAARVVVRHGIEVSPIIPTHFKTYLKTAQRCSFCQGPYFETRFKRGKLIEKNNNLIPLEYTLCMPHWNTETQRVRLLFGPRPLTAPPLPPPRPTTAAATPVSTGSRGSTRRHTKSEPASGPAVSSSNPTFTSSSQMPIIGHSSETSTQESGATPVDPNTESLTDSGNTGVTHGRGSRKGIRSLSSESKSRGLHGSSWVPTSTPASTNSPFTSAPTSSSSASTSTTSGTASPRFSLRLKSRRE